MSSEPHVLKFEEHHNEMKKELQDNYEYNVVNDKRQNQLIIPQ